jgi:hypothetical protein
MSYIGNTFTTQAFTPAVDFFNGNGSTVAFTLSRPVASVAQVQAVISNVPQKPGDAFTVSGNTITFTSAPPSGTQNIYVYYTSPITQVIAPGQGTVGTAQIQNGAVIPADLSTGAPSWDTSGNVTTTGTINNLTVGRGAGSVSTNTAVGASALDANTTGASNTAVGQNALLVNTDGAQNTAVGRAALTANTSGSLNSAFGRSALIANTTGANNTALGSQSLFSNTTASNNTAVGYQAGYANTTGASNAFIGYQAGTANTTGSQNSYLGYFAGGAMTTGSSNTIVGRFTGNQGGLDIRTASNYIVLSDGDGNTAAFANNAGAFYVGGGGQRTYDGVLVLAGNAQSGFGPVIAGTTGSVGSTLRWYIGSNSYIKGGTTYDTVTVTAGAASSGGVNLTSGATSWASASDSRLKNVTGTYTNALADIAQIQAVKFTWKSDEEAKPCVGVIAQSVQPVVPEAIETIRVSKDDETDYLSVKYTELIPLLIASIQELKAEFDAYKEAHP